MAWNILSFGVGIKKQTAIPLRMAAVLTHYVYAYYDSEKSWVDNSVYVAVHTAIP